jgi:hypothetical protein
MTAKLYAALAAAQGEMRQPVKDREVAVSTKTGRSYKFRYATLDACMAVARPVLAKHGLAVVQFVQDGALVTSILHASGEGMDCPLPLPPMPNSPQEAGSLITYFKRYGYCAALGIVADEDDDANAAEGNSIEDDATADAEEQWATSEGAVEWCQEMAALIASWDLERVSKFPNASERRKLDALDRHRPKFASRVKQLAAARYDELKAKEPA